MPRASSYSRRPPEPKRLHTIETGGHNETYLRGGDAYWRALDGFISEAGKPPAG